MEPFTSGSAGFVGLDAETWLLRWKQNSLLIGLSLIHSHLRSPEPNEPEDWHPSTSLSSLEVRTGQNFTQGMGWLHSNCLGSVGTAEKSLPKETVLSWCRRWEAGLLCVLRGLLISRKLCVEGTWEGYELFAEGSLWLISVVKSGIYERNINVMQIPPFAVRLLP